MVAQPTLVFDQAYFTGGADANGVYGYSNYASPLTYLAERPAQMVQGYLNRLAVAGKTVLVVGCGFGLTVQALRAAGVQAWGLDISAYAISQAPADTKPYLVQGDARTQGAWNAAKSLAGLKGKTVFDLAITEDMLSCLSDADALTVAGLARSNAKLSVHLVDDGVSGVWYNDHTASEWKAMLGSDTVVRRFTWQVM